MFKRLLSLFRKPEPQQADAEAEATAQETACCNGRVHIAYRGLSDDRMYMAYNRGWPEVRFFRDNGLRVFCADCRRRLL